MIKFESRGREKLGADPSELGQGKKWETLSEREQLVGFQGRRRIKGKKEIS